MNLSGKNVVYVGGFGGIGFACCKELLTRGLKRLVILDLNDDTEKLQQLQKLVSGKTMIEFLPLNLLHGKEAIETILNTVMLKMGSIDVLVNGSGILNDRQYKLTVDINLTGLIETTLVAVPLMSRINKGSGGLIVNLGSVSSLHPYSAIAVYTATKFGVLGFTRACADPHYYEQTGVMHTVLCPGPTLTELVTTPLQGRDTFDISKPISMKYMTLKNQTAEQCAKLMVQAIEKATNGSVWKIDAGKLEQVKLTKYFELEYTE